LWSWNIAQLVAILPLVDVKRIMLRAVCTTAHNIILYRVVQKARMYYGSGTVDTRPAG